MKVILMGCLLSIVAVGVELNRPDPYPLDSPGTTAACMDKLEQLYNIAKGLLIDIPAATDLKRNDIVIPVIQQTTSVFTPLSAGKKTIKYQLNKTVIQSSSRKFTMDMWLDDQMVKSLLVIDYDDGRNIVFFANWSNGCTGAMDVWPTISFCPKGGYPTSCAGFSTNNCLDKTQTLSALVEQRDQNNPIYGGNAAAQAKINQTATINDLCVFWGY